MTTTSAPEAGPVDYREVQAREEFRDLRRTHRSFVFPMTVFFLIFYLVYVTLGAFWPELFAIRVFGNVNVGLLIGIGQFLTTFLITGIYVRFANKVIDPRAAAIRAELEGHAP